MAVHGAARGLLRPAVPVKAIALTPRKRGLLLAVWIVALAGLLVSVELTRVYDRVYHDIDYRPGCNISAYVNCEAVALSPFAADPLLHIPNSVYGLIFYGLILLATPFRAWTRSRPFQHLESHLALGAMLSFVATLYLASVSTFVLRTLCLWCTALYVVNAVLLALSLILAGRPSAALGGIREDLGLLRRPACLAASLCLAAAIAGLALVRFNSFRSRQEPVKNRVALDVSEAPSIGPVHAPVTLVEFNDLQCPFCRKMHAVLKEMRRVFGPRIRIVFKNFPLDSSCNRRVKTQHPGSCALAHAIESAHQLGAFEPFFERMFEATSYSPEALSRMIRESGMDPARFQARMADPRTRAAVDKDIDDAFRAGITRTPMIVINGEVIEGCRTEREMTDLIKAALQGRHP